MFHGAQGSDYILLACSVLFCIGLGCLIYAALMRAPDENGNPARLLDDADEVARRRERKYQCSRERATSRSTASVLRAVDGDDIKMTADLFFAEHLGIDPNPGA